ncbi:MAG TPA: HEAT repeat domain-containing protein [Amycolatopsis sp.]|uniref:HEAT repeat domain-containing protein n=1 Tax=Amycolatopsis sp. TaxID=37632 RepID=UPI002B46DE32|nr:HEAT repeat domain-containing protein [Amycolatopsis sp.]HKS45307.1 HEAT repeat domain-containing protein [Amycolatopsis sp.]
MISPSTLGLSVVLGSASVLLILALLLAFRRERRRVRRVERVRPLLDALAEGEPDSAERLVRLHKRKWRAAEPAAVALLDTVHDDARDLLLDVLQRRGVVKQAMRQLTEPDPVRRATAARLLGALRQRDAVEPLCQLLVDVHPEVRSVAARALGRIGDLAAVGPLLDSLEKSGPPRQLVSLVLAGLGSAVEKPLLEAMGTGSAMVRATTVDVLGLIRALRAVPVIASALRDPEPEVRVRAVHALRLIGTRAVRRPLLAAVAPRQPPAVRAMAAHALGELGYPSVATRLSALLTDPVPQVAHNAAVALTRLGARGMKALHDHARNPGTPAGAHATAGLALRMLTARQEREAR